MLSEKEYELKVKRYADNNRYTILANTFGFLEYIKYDNKTLSVVKFLKWPKGSDNIIITANKSTKKIKLSELED